MQMVLSPLAAKLIAWAGESPGRVEQLEPAAKGGDELMALSGAVGIPNLDTASVAGALRCFGQHPAMIRAEVEAGHQFMGPNPRRTPPSPSEVFRAQLSLQRGQPLTKRHSEAIVKQTVYAARDFFATQRGDTAFDAKRIAGGCGQGQAATMFALEDLGVSPEGIHLHHTKFGFDENAFYHSFLVAELPGGRNYLVDPTFRQFFDPDLVGPKELGSVGKFLRGSPEGNKLANKLIEDGWVELTDDVANLYAVALTSGARTDITTADLLKSTELRGLDYDRDEIPGLPAPPLARKEDA